MIDAQRPCRGPWRSTQRAYGCVRPQNRLGSDVANVRENAASAPTASRCDNELPSERPVRARHRVCTLCTRVVARVLQRRQTNTEWL